MNNKFYVLILLLITSTLNAADVNLQAHPVGIWSIAGTHKYKRWIVIHNLTEAKHTGIYHIEVIQRNINAPVWSIKRLVKHMAITEAALMRSVISPLTTGAVYPEAFEYALATWQAEHAGKGGNVCNVSVLACLN